MASFQRFLQGIVDIIKSSWRWWKPWKPQSSRSSWSLKSPFLWVILGSRKPWFQSPSDHDHPIINPHYPTIAGISKAQCLIPATLQKHSCAIIFSWASWNSARRFSCNFKDSTKRWCEKWWEKWWYIQYIHYKYHGLFMFNVDYRWYKLPIPSHGCPTFWPLKGSRHTAHAEGKPKGSSLNLWLTEEIQTEHG